MSRKSDDSDTPTRADRATADREASRPESDDREGARPEFGGGEGAGRETGVRLFLLEAGGRLFALPEEAVEATAEHLRPTPLPGAPPAVLGVVCLRGRVRTALDARALLARPDEPENARAAGETKETRATEGATRHAAPPDDTPRVFVALRGDEQLAVAAERAERIEVEAEAVRAARGAGGGARGAFTKDGAEVFILEPSRLFETALRGAERRRKR